jgi:mono/diheme cytochrome c family protein
MARILGLGLIVSAILLAAYGAITLYDETLQVGRMWETPAIHPHEKPLPLMAGQAVPFEGGEAFYRAADAAALKPPFDLNDPAAIARGRLAYTYYCIQCHGIRHDGYGTVGQSFAPTPGDLRSAKVQALPVGQLFSEISYGIPGGRQPPLATTIGVAERWQIIAHIKDLGLRN